ncbi:MAG: hypothetical protein GX898_05365 [Corynebacterium sp.]|nr:hypothetical protein [Corynebacterium sp.]
MRLLEVPEHIFPPTRRQSMWAHYRLAHEGGKAPRLHYLDADDGKIYIGYIGEHLVIPMTS